LKEITKVDMKEVPDVAPKAGVGQWQVREVAAGTPDDLLHLNSPDRKNRKIIYGSVPQALCQLLKQLTQRLWHEASANQQIAVTLKFQFVYKPPHKHVYKFAPICAQSTVQPQGIFVRTIPHICTPLPLGAFQL
jgi:hypothetical protein